MSNWNLCYTINSQMLEFDGVRTSLRDHRHSGTTYTSDSEFWVNRAFPASWSELHQLIFFFFRYTRMTCIMHRLAHRCYLCKYSATRNLSWGIISAWRCRSSLGRHSGPNAILIYSRQKYHRSSSYSRVMSCLILVYAVKYTPQGTVMRRTPTFAGGSPCFNDL